MYLIVCARSVANNLIDQTLIGRGFKIGKRTDASNVVGNILEVNNRFLFTLVLLMALFFTSCIQTEGKNTDSSPSPLNNNYTQIEINLPEGIYYVASLEKTSTGKLWMVGLRAKSEEDLTPYSSLWELKDDNSWEEKLNFSELLELNEAETVLFSHITKNNEILCLVLDFEDYSSGIKFFLIEPELDNSYRYLEIDTSKFIKDNTEEELVNAVGQIISLENDLLLIQNYYGSLFTLDIKNETITPIILKEDNAEWFLLTAAELDETVYVLLQNKLDHTSSKLAILDVTSGTFSDIDTQDYKELNELFSDQGSFSSPEVSTFRADCDMKRITVCLKDGVFGYSNKEVKKIADADGTALSNPAKMIFTCIFENEDDFFLLAEDYSNLEYTLYKYEKTDVPSETTSTLRIWTLEDNDTVRQAAALFKEEHPDVEVKFEVGLNSDGVTTEDAIKRLNTEILAGEGPDVFLVDGLPIESFSEQGLLHNLMNVYTDAADSDLYYENILGAFVSEGVCEVLPIRYSFSISVSENDSADRLVDMSSLVNLITEVVDEELGERPLCNMAVFDDLFIASYPEFFSDEGLNEEAISKFFVNVSSLSEVLDSGYNRRGILPDPSRGVFDVQEPFESLAHGLMYLRESPKQIFISELPWERDILLTELIMQNSEAGLIREVFSLNEYKCFTPRVYVAVNADSKNIELSESFVRMLLSENCQTSFRDGLSIMKSVFIEMAKEGTSMGFEDGTTWVLETLDEETVTTYQTLFLSLDTPVVVDDVVKATVYEELQRYFDKEVTLEDAVNSCCKKINLYLAE